MVRNNPYWTAKAKEDLKEIVKYNKRKGRAIVNDANLLALQPFLGFREPLFEHKAEGFRSLISGNYKIVYYIKDRIVIIATLFDCRQDPDKLKQSIR